MTRVDHLGRLRLYPHKNFNNKGTKYHAPEEKHSYEVTFIMWFKSARLYE